MKFGKNIAQMPPMPMHGDFKGGEANHKTMRLQPTIS
jgi:hypothetical protein